MTETTTASDVAAHQKTATAFIGSVLNSGADPLLKAQADILVSVESTFSDWLRRRHEAVVDTQNLVARLRTNNDPAELLKAQQDWISAAFRRLSADAAAYQSATQQLLERSRGWFPLGTEFADSVVSQATEATRAVTKPLRVHTSKAAE
jgi:hypothetical protein